MKQHAFILGFLCILVQFAHSQEASQFPFNEFQISTNRTDVANENTENRYGFGFGVYHTFMSQKVINVIAGLEYNRTSQFKKQVYESHVANSTDVTYNINFASIPVGLRVNLGSDTKIFIETGGFADLIARGNRTGTMHTYRTNGNNEFNKTTIEFDEKAQLANSVGIYFGLGIRIPIKGLELILKPDYKLELTKLESDMRDTYFRLNVGININ